MAVTGARKTPLSIQRSLTSLSAGIPKRSMSVSLLVGYLKWVASWRRFHGTSDTWAEDETREYEASLRSFTTFLYSASVAPQIVLINRTI